MFKFLFSWITYLTTPTVYICLANETYGIVCRRNYNRATRKAFLEGFVEKGAWGWRPVVDGTMRFSNKTNTQVRLTGNLVQMDKMLQGCRVLWVDFYVSNYDQGHKWTPKLEQACNMIYGKRRGQQVLANIS